VNSLIKFLQKHLEQLISQLENEAFCSSSAQSLQATIEKTSNPATSN
jgi:hypothetical protein